MSKISNDAAEHFWNKVPFSRDNTMVVVKPKGDKEVNCSFMYLFGNLIAQQVPRKDGTIATLITTAEYETVTTKSRLRALGYGVHTHKGQLMLDDYPWDGEWVNPEEIHLGELDDKEEYEYELR